MTSNNVFERTVNHRGCGGGHASGEIRAQLFFSFKNLLSPQLSHSALLQ
jgi:hypothetical protein